MRHASCRPVRSLCCSVCILLCAAGCADSRGQSFTIDPLANPAPAGSAQPNLTSGSGAELVLSWLEPHAGGVALRYTTLGADDWEPVVAVAHGEDWYVNWADLPSVVPVGKSLWAAHWLTRAGESAYAHDVTIALSRDAGRTWDPGLVPHSDATPTEHGFVSLFPSPAESDGIEALWLDGRDMETDGGTMTLRAARLSATGETDAGTVVDGMVCDCCQTDVAMGPEGPIAVYRNRDGREIRDIYATRHVGGTWAPGSPVADDGWKISGCPVNGPAIDAMGAHVAVAWFTGANDKPRVRLARSTDGARTFDAPIDISRIRPVGRVDVASWDDGRAAVSWLRRSTPSEAELCVRMIAADGRAGPVQVVTRLSTARPVLPRMQRYGNQLILAWTDATVVPSAVRTARLHTQAH